MKNLHHRGPLVESWRGNKCHKRKMGFWYMWMMRFRTCHISISETVKRPHPTYYQNDRPFNSYWKSLTSVKIFHAPKSCCVLWNHVGPSTLQIVNSSHITVPWEYNVVSPRFGVRLLDLLHTWSWIIPLHGGKHGSMVGMAICTLGAPHATFTQSILNWERRWWVFKIKFIADRG